ncbi:MAG: N-acetylmuramoyl-L-alanine amidase, partial [Lewinella sp.]|nr:N-acetylmuramoyl-L-alanine amidase [Lewinella sp.]
PIFGPDYAYTPLASNTLRGKVFYIVSGHGGPDPGAIGQRGNYRLCEDEYAYDVALRLCRNLIAHGATAYMINRDDNDGIRNDKFLDCDQDEVIWGGIEQSPIQRTRLTQRSDVINELYEKHRLQGVTEQTAIIIHVDSRSRSERTDVFFYHHPSSEEGNELAHRLHRVMRQKYRQYRTNGDYHGTVSGRDLHMLRECTPTSVYIELANIRNIYDQQRIILERNRQLLADWILEGLMPD